MKNKSNYIAGCIPLAAMLLLFGVKFMFSQNILPKSILVIAIVQILVFVVPIIVAILVGRRQESWGRVPSLSINLNQAWFTIIAACTVSFIAFLANYLFIDTFRIATQPSGADYILQQPGWAIFLLSVLIPAVLEEVMFRGVMQSQLLRFGTAVAIIVPSICFSLLHMNFDNIAGSFIIGLLCGYLTYSFGSVFPAIIAHFICNVYYLVMDFLFKSYEIFGLAPYFLVINLFLFLIFSYFTLRSLERLLVKNKVQKFTKSSPQGFVAATIGSPGVVIMVLIVIMYGAYSLS